MLVTDFEVNFDEDILISFFKNYTIEGLEETRDHPFINSIDINWSPTISHVLLQVRRIEQWTKQNPH